MVKAEETTKRIRKALDDELRKAKRRIAIQDVEAALGHDTGYLHAFRSGAASLSVDKLAMTLEIIQVEPGRFFGSAFPSPPASDYLLAQLRTGGKQHRRVQELERAAAITEGWLVDSDGQPTVAGRRLGVVNLYTRMVGATPHEQCRRLRNGKIYRRARFARRYLEYLDSLRYHDPDNVIHLARCVAVYLLPRTPCDPLERLVLEIRTLGIYASAHRNKGHFATARRALCFALDMARRHRFSVLIAELLQRGAYLLSDHGRYGEATRLLDEAMVIYVKLELYQSLGAVLVDYGHMLNYMGDHSSAAVSFKHALRHLGQDGPRMRRNQLAAHMNLAIAYEQMSELERAEESFGEALRAFGGEQRVNQGKMVWQFGNLAMKRRAFAIAENCFREATELLQLAGDKAQVALDLITALLAQGKEKEARLMAFAASDVMGALRGNEVLDAAATELLRLALAGETDIDQIYKIRRRIEEGRTKTGAPPMD